MSDFVFGIDPASIRNLGVAFLSVEDRKISVHFHSTVVLPDFETDGARYEGIYNSLENLLIKYKPSVVVMELSMGFGKSFVRQNLQESVGVMKLCCHKLNIPVKEIAPTHIKLIMTGSGKAKKREIINSVKSLVNMEKPKTEHEADAVASVLTYFVDKGLIDPFHDPKPKKKSKKKVNDELV